MDERQPVAAQVAGYSIERRSSRPVAITKLIQDQLPIKRRGLTSFTFTRYWVPAMCGFQGLAIFVDADILCRGNIYELAEAADPACAVSVVTNPDPNLRYERPSVMVFNTELCKKLTMDYIHTQTPQKLEDWAGEVGKLPLEWNHLVGYDKPNPNAKLVHFTQGIPCFPETKDSEFSDEWVAEAKASMSTVTWQEIMGASVHREPVLKRLSERRE